MQSIKLKKIFITKANVDLYDLKPEKFFFALKNPTERSWIQIFLPKRLRKNEVFSFSLTKEKSKTRGRSISLWNQPART